MRLLLLLFPAIATAATTATVTPGLWDLYAGTSIVSRGHATESDCVDAAKARNIARTYTCRTRTGVVVSITADPPPTPTPNPDPIPEPNPPPATGSVVTLSSGGNINAALAQLQPGGTVVLKPGTYAAITQPKACTAAAWCTVRAETDGTAIVSGLTIPRGNWYLRIEGLKFTGTNTFGVGGSYVKVLRTAFKGGPSGGNTMAVVIGTNDYTPGASHVLLEDCWAYGFGGRYKFLVYNATDVVLRRVVSRFDGTQAAPGEPQADITVYDSQRVEVQNAIVIDTSTTNSANYIAAFYNVSNGTTGTKFSDVAHRGNIVLNSTGYIMGTEGNGSSHVNLVIEDVAGWKTRYGFSQLKGQNVQYRRETIIQPKGDGFGIFGGSASISDSIVLGAGGKALNGAGCTSCLTGPTFSGVTDLTQGMDGKGARITHRIGVSGTLYGEPGYNTVTSEPLWPWPHDKRITADLGEVRPVPQGSITQYVHSALF